MNGCTWDFQPKLLYFFHDVLFQSKNSTFYLSTRGGYLGQVQVCGANSIISCQTIPEIVHTHNTFRLALHTHIGSTYVSNCKITCKFHNARVLLCFAFSLPL